MENNKTAQTKVTSRGHRLRAGDSLTVGEMLLSPNEMLRAVLQPDGNFVLYEGTHAHWSTSTHEGEPAVKATMQQDGNLVLFDAQGRERWQSRTGGQKCAGAELELQDAGSLVIANLKGEVEWTTKTKANVFYRNDNRIRSGEELGACQGILSPNKKFRLVVQPDGNLVLYEDSGAAWATYTHDMRKSPGKLAMERNGNLVLYDTKGENMWSTDTNEERYAGAEMVLQDDGNIILLREGKTIWDADVESSVRKETRGTGPDRLKVGQHLARGRGITSPNGKCKLVYQSDLNLVLYNEDKAIWATGSLKNEKGAKDRLQVLDDDSIIVGYKSWYAWSSNTRRRESGGNAVLIVQDAGVAVLESDGEIIWSTDHEKVKVSRSEPPNLKLAAAGTDRLRPGEYLNIGGSLVCPSGEFRAELIVEGEVVIYRHGSQKVWSSGNRIERPAWETLPSKFEEPQKLCLLYNGKLVLYGKKSTEYWSMGEYYGKGDHVLLMGNDGNLSILPSSADPYAYGRYPGSDNPASRLWNSKKRYPVSLGPTNQLATNEVLGSDHVLTSENGEYSLSLHNSGNMMITHSDPTKCRFLYNTSRQSKNASALHLNKDDGLEALDSYGKSLWKTGQFDRWSRDLRLCIQNDGTVVVRSDDKVAWKSNSIDQALGDRLLVNCKLRAGESLQSPNGKYRLKLKPNGDLNLLNADDAVVWANPNEKWGMNMSPILTMQPDANLVIYKRENGDSFWATATDGKAVTNEKPMFRVQDDGNCVVYDGSRPLWWSDTVGK